MTAGRPTVLVFRSELLPYSQTFVAAQTRALRAHHPILVGTSRLPGQVGADLADLEVELVHHRSTRWRAPWRPSGPPFDAQSVAALARHRPVLVHAHFGADGFAAVPLAAALGVPLIVTFHGQDASRTSALRDDWRAWGYERRIPLLARRAAHIVAVSDHIRRLLLAKGVPPGAMSVQYIGVDTSVFSPPAEPRDPNLIVAVGRLVEKKGFSVLAEALDRLAATRPHARAVVLGDGPYHAALAATSAARAGRLALLGAAAPDEVRSWLRRAGVVAVPSRTAATGETEGLPTVLLEAMACGATVVASDHAGAAEAVVPGVTGELVPENDAVALARALDRVLGDRELAERYGQGARVRACRDFDLHARTAVLEDLYRQVGDRRRGTAK